MSDEFDDSDLEEEEEFDPDELDYKIEKVLEFLHPSKMSWPHTYAHRI